MKTRKFTVAVIIVLLLIANYTQSFAINRLGIGVSTGATHYLGDVCSVIDLQNARYSFGASFVKRFNSRTSFVTGFDYMRICGQDSLKSATSFQHGRGLNFFTDIYAVKALIKINFIEDYDIYYGDKFYERLLPYSFLGLNAFYFNPKTIYNNQVYNLTENKTAGESYSQFSLGIIGGLGVQYYFKDDMTIGLEGQFCYSLSTWLDDIKPYTYYPIIESYNSPKSVELAYRNNEYKPLDFDPSKAGKRRGRDVSYNDIILGLNVSFNYYFNR